MCEYTYTHPYIYIYICLYRTNTMSAPFLQVHLTGCNCKKSGCVKRYCECYQAGVKCSDNCKCCDCKNPHGAFEGCRKSGDTEGGELLTPSRSRLGLELLLVSGGGLAGLPGRSPGRGTPPPHLPRQPSSPADTLLAAAEAADKAEEMEVGSIYNYVYTFLYLHIYVYIYMYIYICIYIYSYAYMHIYMYTYICVCVCVCVYVYIYIYTLIYMYIYMSG